MGPANAVVALEPPVSLSVGLLGRSTVHAPSKDWLHALPASSHYSISPGYQSNLTVI